MGPGQTMKFSRNLADRPFANSTFLFSPDDFFDQFHLSIQPPPNPVEVTEWRSHGGEQLSVRNLFQNSVLLHHGTALGIEPQFPDLGSSPWLEQWTSALDFDRST